MTELERLKTIKHLIDSAERPLQAMARVLDYIRVEYPSLTGVGIYLVRERRIEPGPWRGTRGNGKTGGRELALRAAYSGKTEQGADCLAIPAKSGDEILGLLSLHSEQPETDFSAQQLVFWQAVADLLRALMQRER